MTWIAQEVGLNLNQKPTTLTLVTVNCDLVHHGHIPDTTMSSSTPFFLQAVHVGTVIYILHLYHIIIILL